MESRLSTEDIGSQMIFHANSLRSCVILFLFIPFCLRTTTFTVTNNNKYGTGSLYQAILDSNADIAQTNTININSGLGAISFNSATPDYPLPVITQSVSINGPDSIQVLQGNNNYRMFFVETGANVTIQNIEINGARAQGGTGGGGGGGGMGAGGGR